MRVKLAPGERDVLTMRGQPMVALVMVAAGIAFGRVDMGPSALHAFFGDSTPELLIYVNRGDRCVYFLDFLADSLVERRLAVRSPARSPMISPDGDAVVFECEGRVFAGAIEEGARTVELTRGHEPHWWVRPDSADTCITYSTEYGKYRWPTPGHTIRRAFDRSSLALVGSADTLVHCSMKGGLSTSGRYLGTGYSTGVIYDLAQDTAYTVYGGAQTCNVSLNPVTDSIAERHMMMLVSPHTTFQIRDIDDRLLWSIPSPGGTVEWQTPEWSNHPDYCTAVATADPTTMAGYAVYAVRISESVQVRILEGDYEYPHLWFRRTGPPRAATPSITPNGGVLGGLVTVSITSSDPEAAIRYTMDGASPSPTSPLYQGPISVNSPCRLTAIA